MDIKSYKNLEVWKKSIDLVDQIYVSTQQFPKSEMYVLASQMQQASIAIPSNIAEGYGRQYTKDYARFLSIAYASALELETHIIIARRQYQKIDYTKAELLLEEIQKMLYVLIIKIRSLGN